MTTIEMRVHMDCPGCESKIRKALLKLKGVENVEIDMEMQKVTVTGWAEQKKVLKTVRKGGRRAEIWQLPHNPHYQNFTDIQQYQQQHSIGYAPQPSSSYNYYKHGYDYGHAPAQSTMLGHHTGAAFSDENPHACSIM
ncbi:heavy metal-associated isoprenylated plant protein 28 [Diospyros lotus]|uniref:heavy metal-associated isoprenylated plant protein 28 n=1 Tax=Diospyros lotus TaxID=55363 RepID=UPI00224E987E|nr:heavy metal-associated isoprenylated plant protein 28 [Diospyros lotus]